MNRRVLITYMSAGLGHLLTAEAIAHYLRAAQPGWDIRLMDLAEELDDWLLRVAYQDTWKRVLRMPAPFARLFLGLDNFLPAASEYVNQLVIRTAVPKASELLLRYEPDLIMSTHWGCSRVFARARADAGQAVPLWFIYGELGEGYRAMNCGADRYFCMTGEAETALLNLRVPAGLIRRVPLLVHPQFITNGLGREEAKRRLGIREDRLTVILSFGGEGIGLSMRFIERFLRDAEGATLVVLTGKNLKLLDRIRSSYVSDKVLAIGYRQYIGDVFAAADVLAGKCGTNYAMLSVKKGIPLLVIRVGAPNERPNMQYIVDNGFGWYCPKPEQFTRRIAELAGDRRRYTEACAGFAAVSRENGAEVIASHIVEFLGTDAATKRAVAPTPDGS